MDGWVKGIMSSLLILIVCGVCYATLIYSGVFAMSIALIVSIITAVCLVTLLSAIDNNDALKGALMPFIALVGILIAYFGHAPIGFTLVLCFFVSAFSAMLVQRDDY